MFIRYFHHSETRKGRFLFYLMKQTRAIIEILNIEQGSSICCFSLIATSCSYESPDKEVVGQNSVVDEKKIAATNYVQDVVFRAKCSFKSNM